MFDVHLYLKQGMYIYGCRYSIATGSLLVMKSCVKYARAHAHTSTFDLFWSLWVGHKVAYLPTPFL